MATKAKKKFEERIDQLKRELTPAVQTVTALTHDTAVFVRAYGRADPRTQRMALALYHAQCNVESINAALIKQQQFMSQSDQTKRDTLDSVGVVEHTREIISMRKAGKSSERAVETALDELDRYDTLDGETIRQLEHQATETTKSVMAPIDDVLQEQLDRLLENISIGALPCVPTDAISAAHKTQESINASTRFN